MTLDEHIIECVLEILNNKRVSKKIYDIVNRTPVSKKNIQLASEEIENRMSFSVGDIDSNEENSRLLEEIPCLKENDEILNLRKVNEDLVAQIKANNEKYTQELAELTRLKDECASLKQENEKFGNFNKPLKVYEVYKSLPEEVKTRNLNFISEKTVFSFISTGIMNLERFWDFIKEELLAGRLRYVDKLMVVFDFFFDMKNDVGQPYERNDCKIGDAFNCEKHIMMLVGKNLSVISEIIFLGFSDSKGRIIRKSVVKVNND